MITLQELLELRTDYFKSSKIKLVRHKDNRKEYKDIIKDRVSLLEYQKEQSNPVFKNTDYIISFIGQEGTKSLLIGFFKVNGVNKNLENGKYYYDLQEVKIKELNEFIDRVVINWGSSTISWHQWYHKQDKEIVELLPKGYLGDFKGITDFVLDFQELKKLIDNPDANRDWYLNLSSINGVYMILDKKTGNQYIGSAYGIGGIWQRWSDYASNGHGGNQKLIELCNGNDNYQSNFQFTILKSLPSNLNSREVIKIENLYKDKFGTKAFGLNQN